MQDYVVYSLELHLFFARIMKEHSLFLEAGYVQKNQDFIERADYFRTQFENLLGEVVNLSNGMIRSNVLESGEIVTEFTMDAEKSTDFYTGISIDTEITALEEELRCCDFSNITPQTSEEVTRINQMAIELLNGLIELKEDTLDGMLSCNMFTVNYPLLIKHILREAELYRSYVIELEDSGELDDKNRRDNELFWNEIMMEHALFIRGLLDPSEYELVNTSNNLAEDFANLYLKAKNMTDETIESITDETIMKTIEIRDFKETGVKGIEACEIQSIILPLLADHVLREANHYLRLLTS